MTEFQAGAYRPASREQLASWLLGRGPIEDLGFFEGSGSFASGHSGNSYGPRNGEPVSPLVDAGKAIPAGVRAGAESGVGAGGDIVGLQDRAIHWILEKTGGSQEYEDYLRHITSNFTMWSRLPSTDGIRRNVTNPVLGEGYQPQTTLGQYAHTGSEFLGGAFLPGGPIRKAAMVAMPAVASETAGQLTEGTPWEPWARFAGALAGGGLAAASPGRAPRTAGAVAGPDALTRAKISLIRALQQRGYSLETLRRRLANYGAAGGGVDGRRHPSPFDAFVSSDGRATYDPAWWAFAHPETTGDNWREPLAALVRQELDGSKPLYYVHGPGKWVGPLGNHHGPTITQPFGRMKPLSDNDRHHIMQQATIRHLDTFRKADGPSIYLDGPSRRVGSAHYHATQMQRRSWAENMTDEVLNAVEIVEKTGNLPPEQRYYLAWEIVQYLKFLGVTADTPIRVPGNRKKPK